MISVVLANYNGASFLREAIESVICQNFDDFEFIIVDDGSTDDSVDIINNAAKKSPHKVKPIFQSTNQGQGISFNIGVNESKGSIICFMDSDDIWFPDKLKKVHGYFSLGLENIAFWQHNLYFIRGSELTRKKFRDTLPSGNLYKLAKETKKVPGPFIPTSGLIFPKRILEEVLPIPQDFRICADGYLTRTSLCYGEVMTVWECLGGYRVHSNNNIFENEQYSSRKYLRNLLIPNLNTFYKNNGFDLKLRKPYRFGLLSTCKTVVRYFVSPIVPNRIDSLKKSGI